MLPVTRMFYWTNGLARRPCLELRRNCSTATILKKVIPYTPDDWLGSQVGSLGMNNSTTNLSGLRGGFTLIESLVALLLVTLAIFLALHLTTIQPRTMKRLEANQAALRAVEASLETLRGGQIPMVVGKTPLRL